MDVVLEAYKEPVEQDVQPALFVLRQCDSIRLGVSVVARHHPTGIELGFNLQLILIALTCSLVWKLWQMEMIPIGHFEATTSFIDFNSVPHRNPRQR
jgi:hypothetical protein